MAAIGSRRRIYFLHGLLLLWGGVIWVRLFRLQVLDYSHLRRRARNQQSRLIRVRPRRGVIYDRRLHPLALSLPVESVFAVPGRVIHPRAESRQLAAILQVSAAGLRRRWRMGGDFCWVARQIPAAQSNQIRALHLPGIEFEAENRRFYPKGRLAGQVLGYVGLDGNGLGGLEYSLNRSLAGKTGRELVEVDAHGRVANIVERPPREGESYVLTLDQYVQYIAQKELDHEMRLSHARRGTVVVERRDGALLALASAPSFNPNHFARASARALQDGVVSDVYEPGSVFKLVTLSAALQQGLANPQTMVNCQMGSIKVGGVTIYDHAKFGLLSVTQILAESSDVGAIKMGLRLGPRRLYRYIRAYGFGRRVGVGLPGESAGILRPPSQWSGMSIGSLSMGQEIAVTPLQVAAMITRVADGGLYRRPQLIRDRFYGEPPAVLPRFQPSPARRVISARVSAEMRAMMGQVINPLPATGWEARLNGYSVGGKTGTAQMVLPGTHAYAAHSYVASFGGVVPLSKPEITILVVLDDPIGLHDGGTVAAPVFRRIAERILPYLGIPHDEPFSLPAARTGYELSQAGQGMPANPVRPPDIFAREAQAALPAGGQAAQNAPSSSTVVVDYSGGPALPNFAGQTVGQVAAYCARHNLAPRLYGSGLARAQSPAAGSHLMPGERVLVEFSRRLRPHATIPAGHTGG